MFAKRTVVEYSLFQTADKQRTKKTDDTSPKKKEVKLPIHGKKKLQKNKEVKLPIYGKRKLHEEYRSLTSEIREEKLRTFVNLLKEQISTALKIRQSSLVPKECLHIYILGSTELSLGWHSQLTEHPGTPQRRHALCQKKPANKGSDTTYATSCTSPFSEIAKNNISLQMA